MGAGVGASVSRVSRGPCRRRAGTPTAARISGITPGGLFCWYAVLSLNHIGHAMEESLWSLLMLMLSAIAGTAALAADGSLRAMLIACFLIYGVGAGLTMAFDVRMYVRRWRLRTDDPRLTLATGWHDSRKPPAPDDSLGGLARGSTVDDSLFQHRCVDESGHGAPLSQPSDHVL